SSSLVNVGIGWVVVPIRINNNIISRHIVKTSGIIQAWIDTGVGASASQLGLSFAVTKSSVKIKNQSHRTGRIVSRGNMNVIRLIGPGGIIFNFQAIGSAAIVPTVCV